MADITKCKGEGCPKKETCYRYTAEDSMRQSYFITSPNQGENCEYFSPNL